MWRKCHTKIIKKTNKINEKKAKKALDSIIILVYSSTINKERESYIMKKLILILAVLWLGLNAFAKSVQANDSTTATVAHIITQKIQGNNVDTSVLEAELSRLAYEMSLEMTSILEKHLPYILEGIAQELKMKSDSAYKCSLLKDTKIKDKECS